MEAIIRSQTEGKKVVDELDLSSWKGDGISEEECQLLESFEHLASLTMNGSGLQSLANFPELKSLVAVELNSNNISELESLSPLRSLMQVCLEGNNISSFDALAPLKRLTGLLSLDLHGNPIANDPGYPKRVFEMIPSLRAVDGLDRQGNKVDEIGPEPDLDSDSAPPDEDDEYDAGDDDEDDDEGLSDLDEEISDLEEEELPAKKRRGRPRKDAGPNKKRKNSD